MARFVKEGNKIYEGSKAAFYLDGNYVREIREGRSADCGPIAYYIDGNVIREGGSYGKRVYYIDGSKIRKVIEGRDVDSGPVEFEIG